MLTSTPYAIKSQLKNVKLPRWFKEEQAVTLKKDRHLEKKKIFYIRDIRGNDICSLSLLPKKKMNKVEYDSVFRLKDLIPVGISDWWID